MKNKILPGLLLIFVACRLPAQEVLLVGTKPSVAGKRTIKPTVGLDIRFSALRDHNQESANVRIRGLRAGVIVETQKAYKAGLGYYFLNTRTDNLRTQPDNSGLACTGCYATRKLDFGTAYFEPFWLRRQYWLVSTPLEIGYGRAAERYYDAAAEIAQAGRSGGFVPAGLSVSVILKPPAIRHFRPLQWFGLNALAGYRYVLEGKDLAADYDGVFYTIRLAFFLNRLTDDVKDWRKARKKRRTEK